MPRQCRMQLVGPRVDCVARNGTPVSDVCCWHLADIGSDAEHVRSWG